MKTQIQLSDSVVEVDTDGKHTGMTYKDMIAELLTAPDYYSAYRPGMKGLVKISQNMGDVISFFDIQMDEHRVTDKLTLEDVTANDWKISVYAD